MGSRGCVGTPTVREKDYCCGALTHAREHTHLHTPNCTSTYPHIYNTACSVVAVCVKVSVMDALTSVCY